MESPLVWCLTKWKNQSLILLDIAYLLLYNSFTIIRKTTWQKH